MKKYWRYIYNKHLAREVETLQELYDQYSPSAKDYAKRCFALFWFLLFFEPLRWTYLLDWLNFAKYIIYAYNSILVLGLSTTLLYVIKGVKIDWYAIAWNCIVTFTMWWGNLLIAKAVACCSPIFALFIILIIFCYEMFMLSYQLIIFYFNLVEFLIVEKTKYINK